MARAVCARRGDSPPAGILDRQVRAKLQPHYLKPRYAFVIADQDLNRLKKLIPRSKGPVSSATLPFTSSKTTGPTFNDLMRKVVDFFPEPSASVAF
jgi:hypothetical protein